MLTGVGRRDRQGQNDEEPPRINQGRLSGAVLSYSAATVRCMVENWLGDEVWSREPLPEAPRLDVVYDADMGAIASLTLPDGTVFTSADSAK